ncbi:LPD28 domain-containing protein [Bacteroides sp. MSK.20.82]|uniref:LPD28 domain-containing protein n=1 Tax=Bacteroides sp. MSK.20.82 TaxID=2849174 RepID=UPI0020B85EA1|nr:LPD28 domain-containing protein [Bacteroides sp. MSK.20.82]
MITQRNIQDESFDSMTVNGMPALFTNFRIDRNAVPEGHAYDIRESDDGGRFATIEPEVMVNHAEQSLQEKSWSWEKTVTCGLKSTDLKIP